MATLRQIILDISRWQGIINPALMWAAGVRVIKLRATIGNYYQDAMVREYVRVLRAFVAPDGGTFQIGFYHVVRPDNSAASQVDNLFSLLDSMGFRGDIPITIDDEVDSWVETIGPIKIKHSFPREQVTQRARQVTEMIEQRDGRIPEYYASWNHVRSAHVSDPDQLSWMVRHPLHVPWYGSTDALGRAIENNEASFLARERVPDTRIPHPWLTAWKAGVIERPYNLWQGTDKASGSKWGTSSNNTADLNKPWPGLDYHSLYRADPPPPPPPPDPLTDEQQDSMLHDHERRIVSIEGRLAFNPPAPPSTPGAPPAPDPGFPKATFDLMGDHGGAIDAYENLGDRPGTRIIGKYGKRAVVEDLGGSFMGSDWMQVRGPLLGEGGSHVGWVNKRQATLVPAD